MKMIISRCGAWLYGQSRSGNNQCTAGLIIIVKNMEAFKIQLYPYKEHPEIIKDLFGNRFDKPIDTLFPLFDYISTPVMEVGGWKRAYFIIQKGNLFGVIKDDGSIFISPKYVQVIPTEDNRFLLLSTDFKWGLIGIPSEYSSSKRGNIFNIPCRYDEIGDYSEGFYVVRNNGKYGFAPLIQENLSIYPSYDEVRPFHEGFAAVKRNGRWGFIDKTLSNISKFEFDEVFDYENGVADVWKNGEKHQISFNGNDINETEIPFGNSYELVGKYHEGLCAVQDKGRLGFIDTFGNIRIPLEYHYDYNSSYCDNANCFSEGFACVNKGGRWGYIDKQNRVVFPFILDSNKPILNGYSINSDGLHTSRLVTCNHFFNYTHGKEIPFFVDRPPRKSKSNSYDRGWSWNDLNDAYLAALEDDIRNEWNID